MQLKDLKLEILFLNQQYNYITHFKNSNNEILNKIRNMQDKGYGLTTIKKYLYSHLKELYKYVKKDIEDIQNSNNELIKLAYNYDKDINNKSTFTMGMNLDDLINAKIYYHLNLVIRDLIIDELKVNAIKRKTINSITTSTYDYLKSDRQHIIGQIEKSNTNIKGWLYSAILDRRTSNLCISLNNKFYSRKVYKDRSKLPYIPNVNTHPNCRSILITIYKDDDIKDYKGLSIQEFIKNEKYEVKKLLGTKKYKLMIENNLSFNEIFNYKNNKFYTNKEIEQKIKENILK